MADDETAEEAFKHLQNGYKDFCGDFEVMVQLRGQYIAAAADGDGGVIPRMIVQDGEIQGAAPPVPILIGQLRCHGGKLVLKYAGDEVHDCFVMFDPKDVFTVTRLDRRLIT